MAQTAMRIAIVTDYLSLSRGGSECYLFSLVTRLVAGGHDVHVFHSRPGDRIEGGHYHLVQVPAYPRFVREWSFCRQVNRQARELGADAIFALRPLASATHYRLSNGVYRRCLEAEHEALDIVWRRLFYRTGLRLNPKQQLLIHGQNEVLGRPDRPRLMTNSNLARRHLQEAFGIPPEEVTVLYSGVDFRLFHPEPPSRPIPGRLVFVAHHFTLKGLHCLIAAMAALGPEGSGLSLQVVGGGKISQYRKRAARLGILSRVQFLGGVTRARMPELYRSSTVMVLPTFYDPCSLATLEAMACGCPVITTGRNGASELIQSGRNGWVIDHPRDVWSLAAAVKEALRPGVSEELGREAAKTARERLDLNDHVKAVTRWLGDK